MRKIISGRRSSSKGDFIMKVNTSLQTTYGGQTPSGTNQFFFPIPNGSDLMGYTISFEIDWGDGSTSQVNSSNHGTACLHTYSSPGVKTIKARGNIAGFNFWQMIGSPGKADGNKLLEIVRWGDLKMTGGGSGSAGQMFRDCDNLATISANDTPWFVANPLVPSILNSRGGRATFSGCGGLTTINNIANWDVSRVDTLEIMFSGCGKLQYGTNASGPIDLSNWDVSRCFRFQRMFNGCGAFNGKMFSNLGANLPGTIPGGGINFLSMFRNCINFTNQNSGTMNSWDTQHVNNMTTMFQGCSVFNDNIINWDTANVTNMREMFAFCSVFNQNISGWDVSSVTDMRGIFTSCTAFDQPIASWNVNAWSAYSTGTRPLESATSSPSFNLSTTNYSNLLIAWDAYNFPNWPGGIVDFGSSQYSLVSPGNQVALARASLVNKWGAINDGGGV